MRSRTGNQHFRSFAISRTSVSALEKLCSAGHQIGPLFLSSLSLLPPLCLICNIKACFPSLFSQLHPLVRRHGPDASLPHLQRRRHLQQPLPAEHLLRIKLGEEPHRGVGVRHLSDARSLQEHLCAFLFALPDSQYVGLSYILHYSQVSRASA